MARKKKTVPEVEIVETSVEVKPGKHYVVYSIDIGVEKSLEAYTTVFFGSVSRLVEFLNAQKDNEEGSAFACYTPKNTLQKTELDVKKITATLRSGDTYHTVLRQKNKHLYWYNINQNEVIC